MERTKFFPDSRDPTLVVRGWVKCSKDGEPMMDLFAPVFTSTNESSLRIITSSLSI